MTTAAGRVCWFPAHALDPAPGTRSVMSSGGRTGPPRERGLSRRGLAHSRCSRNAPIDPVLLTQSSGFAL